MYVLENVKGSLLTEINVPGRKTMVTAAIVIMDELSLFVSIAILDVRLAMFKLLRLSICEAILKKRCIISCVRSS